jgi:DNA-binding NtrC family response regulator
VVLVQLPPLRERKEDIPLLVEFFLERESKKRGDHLSIEAPVMDVLMNHDWPGNVRELENVLAHAFVLSKSARIAIEALPSSLVARQAPGASLGDNVPYREAKQRLLEGFDRAYLKELMHRCEGNVSQAARIADMDRKNLYDLLKKNGLMPSSEPTPNDASAV